MATETHVFFRGKLPSKAALTRAMKELGFPLAVRPATGSLEQQSGFMPMTLWREETGAEFDVYNDHSAVAEFADAGIDPSFTRRASFRWGGNRYELAAGLCGTAALAKLVNGIAFDPQEGRLQSIDEAIAVATKYLASLPKPSTGPAQRSSSKKILAPLLAKRSDLVLVGDFVLIRPVCHIVRGAGLHWTHRGRNLKVYPFIRAIYETPYIEHFRDPVYGASVSYADFEAVLFDRLAGDVFARLGKITTLADYKTFLWQTNWWNEELFATILLSEGVERASDYLAPIARSKRGQALQARLDGDRAALFAHYRRQESDVVRALNIEHAWEASPFPAELPARARAKANDPPFPAKPWLDFPTAWRQDPPDKPGELRFGLSWWRRGEEVMLVSTLTREQAEEEHRKYLSYKLMTRLPEGHVLIQSFWTSSNPAREDDGSIKAGERIPNVSYRLHIFSSERQLIAYFHQSLDRSVLEMWTLDVRTEPEEEEKWHSHLGLREAEWHSHLNFPENKKTTHDYRLPEMRYKRRPMTAADRTTYTFPLPGFGEFEGLWQRIAMYLRNEGFGTFV
jgi:hypothetical protein